MRSVHSAATVIAALLVAPCVTAMVQQDTAAVRPAAAYSTEQAARGADVYRGQCSACHLPKDHYSADFQQSWGGRTVKALYDYIRSTMPDDSPATLTEKQYLDVTAYILKLNGMPAGESALTSDSTVLSKLTIDIKPRTPAPR